MGATFTYRNGYFCCNLEIEMQDVPSYASFGLFTLDAPGGSTFHMGNVDRGVFVNLSSVRELL